MTDTPTLNNDHGPGFSGTVELVKRATQDGATSAREAATRTWAATSRFACRFTYTTCYTLSYGVVFPVTFIACSIPKNNAAIRGLVDGARAAKAKVESMQEKPFSLHAIVPH